MNEHGIHKEKSRGEKFVEQNDCDNKMNEPLLLSTLKFIILDTKIYRNHVEK